MPTAQVGLIPIPLGLNLCGSFADQQLFIQLVNLNLSYILKLLQDSASITITVPGVPGFNIGIPGLTIPGFPSRPIGYGNERPDLQDGWIGGRFPMGHPPEPIFGQGKLPGVGDFSVGGANLGIAGTDPYTMTMQIINNNIELILEQVPALENFVTDIPVMINSPCQNQNPAQAQAQVQQQLQTVNTLLNQIIAGIPNLTPAGVCTPLPLPLYAPDGTTDNFSTSPQVYPNWTFTQAPGAPNSQITVVTSGPFSAWEPQLATSGSPVSGEGNAFLTSPVAVTAGNTFQYSLNVDFVVLNGVGDIALSVDFIFNVGGTSTVGPYTFTGPGDTGLVPLILPTIVVPTGATSMAIRQHAAANVDSLATTVAAIFTLEPITCGTTPTPFGPI